MLSASAKEGRPEKNVSKQFIELLLVFLREEKEHIT